METQKSTKLKRNPGFSNENCKLWDTVQLLAEADNHLTLINESLKKKVKMKNLNKKDEIETILGDIHSKLLNLKYVWDM